MNESNNEQRSYKCEVEERERKRGLNKWKTNLCSALSRKNLHLTTTILTSYASHAFHVFLINNCCFIHEIISHQS